MNATRWFGRMIGAVLSFAFLAAPASADDEGDLLAFVGQAEKLRKEAKYEEAAANYEKALVLAPKVFGNDHENTGILLNNLAGLYRASGQYAKAETLYQRCLTIREAKLGKDHSETAGTLNNLGALYFSMGEYAKAETLFQRALDIREAKLGKEHQETAETLNNMAELYRAMGQYTKAEPLFLRSLSIKLAKFGKDHPETAVSASNLANLYSDMGLYARAEPLFKRSLAINEAALGEGHDTADALSNLAVFYRVLGQYVKAEPLFLRALAIYETKLGKDHPETATALNSLAVLYYYMDQNAKAEPLFQRTLTIREAKLGADHPKTAITLNNLANLYSDTNQYAKAEPLYLKALSINENKLGKEHPTTALALNNLAGLYRVTGQYAKAEPIYLRALAIYEAALGKDDTYTAGTILNLAFLDACKSEWDQSVRYQDRFRRHVRGFAASILPFLSEKEQKHFLKTQDAFNFYVALSHGLLRRDHPAERDLSAGWLLNGKAVSGQVQAESVLSARESRDTRSGAISKQLLEIRQTLAALTLQPPKGMDAATRSRQIAELSAKEQDLSRRSSQITGREVQASWVEPADVRKALPQSSVLIEIARFDRKNVGGKPGEKFSLGDCYAAWIIPQTGDIRIIDLGDAKPIDDAVAFARKELESAAKTIAAKGEPAAEKQLRKPMEDLVKLVLNPLLPHIGNAKTWILSPDSNLWLVPWGALPLPDGKYVVESHTINYVVTGRDLLAKKNTSVKPTAPLMLADPDFDIGLRNTPSALPELHRGLSRDFKLGNVRRLPGTAAEAEAILPHLEKFTREKPILFIDQQASTEIFKATKNPRIVVLSTHGFFLEEEKIEGRDKNGRGLISDDLKPAGPISENALLRCGLLLAGCNNAAKAKPGGDTGVLTGLEIVGTDLRGTEMVVLSACETGLGDIRNGEGVAGLRQAFQLAGAESVVATLWQVPDRESALLMIGFFDNIGKGQSRDEALRNSQLDQIQKRQAKNGAAHPYFWAAYTLTGQAK